MTEFQDPIKIIYNDGEKEIKTLNDYLDVILSSIGIKDATIISQIKSKFNKYDKSSYKLFSKADVINKILKSDSELNKLIITNTNGTKGDLYQYYVEGSDFKKNWDNLMSQFATLQGLIIIKKLGKNIDAGVDSLIVGLANKLKAANNLIEENLFD